MRLLKGAALAAGLTLAASSASAAVIEVSMSGTLSHGYDGSGLFGAAGSDLTGAIFTVVSYFDTDIGQVTINGGKIPSEMIAGGTAYGFPSPGLTTLTVGGVSINLPGALDAYLVKSATALTSSIQDQMMAGDITTSSSVVGTLYFGSPKPFDLGSDAHGDCGGADVCTGSFSIGRETTDTHEEISSSFGAFNISTFDVTAQGGVPEPAIWAMMIAGFGLVGATLRRRRAAAAV